MYDNLGRLTDATGVQVPGVLDDLYARAASRGTYGTSWHAGRPSFSLWAPTAQAVSLLVWPAGASGTAPVSDATRVAMRRGADGAWTADGRPQWRGARYLYEVRVYAPTTGKVETNLVTDPLLGGADPELHPFGGGRPVRPGSRTRSLATEPVARRKQDVDSSIYELHVRDFSVG
jgi:1,4-alpha-glucan branching enzyme